MGESRLDRIREILSEAARLTVFEDVLNEPIGSGFLAVLRALSHRDSDAEGIARSYGHLFALLASETELAGPAGIPDAWQGHLLRRLLAADNAFSRKAEMSAPSRMGESLLAAARHDLKILELLFRLDAEAIARLVAGALGGRAVPRWDRFAPATDLAGEDAHGIELAFLQTSGWDTLVETLAEHYRTSGAGDFGRYRAFRWIRRGEDGALEGAANPDPVQLAELIGYSDERDLVIQNTEHFVAGYAANNVLLYGDRGTGKSSTIKALLNAFSHRGLRLVEVSKQHLDDFPSIVRLLRGRGERFILFVDDLSFEDNETHYKELKAVLEGGLEVRPYNVLLYATSNRRHLVRERFGDRGNGSSDELHARDTMEEKLSLSDRFGITVTFTAPNQERYLEIVSGLAAQRGLDIAREELEDLALKWAARHNGRSGRTARQFVDHLEAALALNTKLATL